MSNFPTRPAAPFFEEPLATRDAPVRNSILKELERQQSQVELIASENIVSRAVLEAQGSVLTNNMRKVIQASGITAAANSSMKSKPSRSIV